MSLKTRTETTHFVIAHDLDSYVRAVYPQAKDYSFAASQETENDTDYVFNDLNGVLDDEEFQDLIRFQEGDVDFVSNWTILNDLVRKGHIPAGTYIVQVSW